MPAFNVRIDGVYNIVYNNTQTTFKCDKRLNLNDEAVQVVQHYRPFSIPL